MYRLRVRNPHAGQPFTAAECSDDDLAAMLEDLSVPALLLSCVHMSEPADRDAILSGPLRPAGSFLNEYQGFMDPADLAAARALALDVVRAWRDRGCPEPEPLAPGQLEAMMRFAVAADVDPDYVPMMAEELGLDMQAYLALTLAPLAARARATETRWRMPPESSPGRLCTAALRLTRSI